MHPPFGGWRHHLSAPLGSVSLDSQSPTAPCESSSLATASGGTITRAYCRAIYEESVSRCFILPPEQGEVRRSRIRGWRAQRANQQNCFSYHMTQKANLVTLTLYLSPEGAIPPPAARQGCRPLSGSEHNLPPLGGHNPRAKGPSTLTPKAL